MKAGRQATLPDGPPEPRHGLRDSHSFGYPRSRERNVALRRDCSKCQGDGIAGEARGAEEPALHGITNGRRRRQSLSPGRWGQPRSENQVSTASCRAFSHETAEMLSEDAKFALAELGEHSRQSCGEIEPFPQ